MGRTMSEEFWNEIERKSTDLRSKQNQEAQRRMDNSTFFQDILPVLSSTANRYRDKLQSLNFNAVIDQHDDSLIFRLTWANGADLHLSVSRDEEFGCLRVESGEGHGWTVIARTPDGELYDRGKFNPYMYEGRLQRLITEFTERAPDNGGL